VKVHALCLDQSTWERRIQAQDHALTVVDNICSVHLEVRCTYGTTMECLVHIPTRQPRGSPYIAPYIRLSANIAETHGHQIAEIKQINKVLFNSKEEIKRTTVEEYETN